MTLAALHAAHEDLAREDIAGRTFVRTFFNSQEYDLRLEMVAIRNLFDSGIDTIPVDNSSKKLISALNELKNAVISYTGSRLLSSREARHIADETNKLTHALVVSDATPITINAAMEKFKKNTVISSGCKCRIALHTFITTIIGAAIGFWFGFIAGAVIGGAIGAGYGLYASREDLAKCRVEAKLHFVLAAARSKVS